MSRPIKIEDGKETGLFLRLLQEKVAPKGQFSAVYTRQVSGFGCQGTEMTLPTPQKYHRTR
jgi:hypothetical protein